MTERQSGAMSLDPALLLDALDAGYFQSSPDRTQIVISPRGLEMFGLVADTPEGIRRQLYEIIGEEQLSAIRADVIPRIQSGQPFSVDVEVVRPTDRERCVVRVRGRAFTDGPSAGMALGTLEDVTEQVDILQELAATRLQLETAEKIGETGSWTWHVRTGEVRWSSETFRICGVDPSVTPSFALVRGMAIDEEHALKFEQRVRDSLEQDVPYEFEMPAKLPDGRHILLHTRGAVERDREGHPVRMIGTMRDVTRARGAERELQEREARFRLLAESSPNGVFLTNKDGVATYASQRLLDWYECTFEEFAAGSWLDRIVPDDRRLVLDYEAVPENRGRPFRADYRIITRGETRYMRVRTEPIIAPDGSWLGHVGNVEDATAEHRAASERAKLEERAQQARKLESVGLLAGGIAHDFNNLLVGVLANASFAREMSDPDSPIVEALEDIERSAHRAAELTRQLLTYAGRASVRREVLDLAEMVAELPSLLGARIPPEVSLSVQLDTAQARVLGDRAELRQVVMNLVTNAVDSIEGTGRVRLFVSHERWSAERLASCLLGADRPAGEYVVVTVQDSGRGMSPDVRERMFDPFFSTKGTGRGLGLAATLGLLNSHAGAVVVDSEPGRGTKIQVLLPAIAAEPPQEVREPDSAPPERVAGLVLLADDDASARKAAVRVLERTGYSVVQAADGGEAVQRFAERIGQWACVVLDLTMPVLTGDLALAEIRKQDSGVPVLIISGYAAEDVAARLTSGGAVQFLQKPYVAAELLRAIEVARAAAP